jgi:hypothetical protein
LQHKLHQLQIQALSSFSIFIPCDLSSARLVSNVPEEKSGRSFAIGQIRSWSKQTSNNLESFRDFDGQHKVRSNSRQVVQSIDAQGWSLLKSSLECHSNRNELEECGPLQQILLFLTSPKHTGKLVQQLSGLKLRALALAIVGLQARAKL